MNVTKIPKKTISVIEPKRSLIVNREQYHQRRVAAYCRVSTDSEEQLTSYTNQKKVYMREWMKEYTDQLPEYNYLLDELLG